MTVLDFVGLFLIVGLAALWLLDHWSKQGRIEGLLETVASAHALYSAEVGRSGEAAKRRDEYALQVDELTAHLAAVPEKPPVYTPEEIKNFEENRCVHCGGSHAIACPRIKSIRFRADGATPVSVEFWADWPQDRVTYLEDILPPVEEPVSGG